ncbi:MAG: YncE family protein, partial [Candidatus Nitrosopolaris sp.]
MTLLILSITSIFFLVLAHAGQAVATNSIISIPVGSNSSQPDGIAYNPINGNMYVGLTGDASVSVIDVKTNKEIKEIPLFNKTVIGLPSGIAYDPFNKALLVTVEDHKNDSQFTTIGSFVYRIDPKTDALVAHVLVAPNDSEGIAYDPYENTFYVANSGSSNVSVINGTTNTVIKTIPVGTGPTAIAYDSVNHNVYVGNGLSDTVSVINGTTNTVIKTFHLKGPINMAYNPDNDKIYLTSSAYNSVSVIQ